MTSGAGTSLVPVGQRVWGPPRKCGAQLDASRGRANLIISRWGRLTRLDQGRSTCPLNPVPTQGPLQPPHTLRVPSGRSVSLKRFHLFLVYCAFHLQNFRVFLFEHTHFSAKIFHRFLTHSLLF